MCQTSVSLVVRSLCPPFQQNTSCLSAFFRRQEPALPTALLLCPPCSCMPRKVYALLAAHIGIVQAPFCIPLGVHDTQSLLLVVSIGFGHDKTHFISPKQAIQVTGCSRHVHHAVNSQFALI